MSIHVLTFSLSVGFRHVLTFSHSEVCRPILTFKAPRNHSVGSRPKDKIILDMVDIIRVLMANGYTPTLMTNARDPNMTVHTNPDMRGSSSETDNNLA